MTRLCTRVESQMISRHPDPDQTEHSACQDRRATFGELLQNTKLLMIVDSGTRYSRVLTWEFTMLILRVFFFFKSNVQLEPETEGL